MSIRDQRAPSSTSHVHLVKRFDCLDIAKRRLQQRSLPVLEHGEWPKRVVRSATGHGAHFDMPNKWQNFSSIFSVTSLCLCTKLSRAGSLQSLSAQWNWSATWPWALCCEHTTPEPQLHESFEYQSFKVTRCHQMSICNNLFIMHSSQTHPTLMSDDPWPWSWNS